MKAPAAKKDRKRHNIVDPREAVSKAEDYEPPSKIDKDFELPEDWLNAPEDFMSVAKLANIPAENTHKFLHAFNRAVYDFRLTSLLDADRRNYEDPIKEIYAACEALIIALDYLDECEGGPAMLDCFFPTSWTVRAETEGRLFFGLAGGSLHQWRLGSRPRRTRVAW